jgi:hypothetical protein
VTAEASGVFPRETSPGDGTCFKFIDYFGLSRCQFDSPGIVPQGNYGLAGVSVTRNWGLVVWRRQGNIPG